MNKNQLINQTAARSGVTAQNAREVLDAALATIAEAAALGDKVTLSGFGTFEGVAKAERIMRNPSNGEDILVPATRLPRFKALKGFRDIVAGRTPVKTGQGA